MKIIDKTPLQDEKGQIGILQRLQGTLKFGMNWYAELQAQKTVISQLERQLDKGYTLIRNYTLGASGIVVPLILLGPAGIYVIHVTHLRGMYQAKGDSWGTISNGRFAPAPINLLQRTMRFARALQVFIERQGVKLPVAVEPVLIAADPGMHIESIRPVVRVVMVDAVKQFVASLLQGRPVLSTESAYEFVDRILNPRPPKSDSKPAAGAAPVLSQQEVPTQRPVSRAKAIFDAAQEAKPFNPADFDFAMIDELPASEGALTGLQDTGVPEPLPRPAEQVRKIFGLSIPQFALLVAMGVVEIFILIGFAVVIYLTR